MSVNVELKTAKQNNKTWSLSFKANSRIPIVAERTYATLADAQTWVNDLAEDATAYPGAIIAVVNDGKNNGIYYVASIAQAATETSEFVPGVLVSAGAGAGSETVETFTVGEDGKITEAENIGQILYVTTGTTAYPAGPYIVTGIGAVAKLGTTTATGDIAGDVENLKGRMSTAEGEIDALQVAVGDANSGLVKGLADANSAIDEIEKTVGEHAESIAANATAVEDLRKAVAGGVHFAGVYPELPVYDEANHDFSWSDESDEHHKMFAQGDVIIVANTGDMDVQEPNKEYILVQHDSYIFEWVELGDCSVSDSKIATLQKAFDDHVAEMNESLAPTIAAAADYTASKPSFALAANVVANTTYNEFVEGVNGRLDDAEAAINAFPIKSVTTSDELKLSEAGALSIDLSGFVAKNGDDRLMTKAEGDKLAGIAAGAQVNVIEAVHVNGAAIDINNKIVNIDVVDSLAGKVNINGQVLAETDNNGVLSATLDASHIKLGATIGDKGTDTTVQDMLANVYNIAVAKVSGLTAGNGINLVKGNDNNYTVGVKIAENSAITATANGLDLIWTEL